MSCETLMPTDAEVSNNYAAGRWGEKQPLPGLTAARQWPRKSNPASCQSVHCHEENSFWK